MVSPRYSGKVIDLVVKKYKSRKIFFIALLLIANISYYEIKAPLNIIYQQDLSTTEYFPSPASISNSIHSKSDLQQQNVLSYLENSWNLSKITEYSIASAIEIISKSVIACSSVSSTSVFEIQIYEAFNLILSSKLANSKETLNMSSDGLFYIWDGITKNVSTSMNIWIAKALIEVDKSIYSTAIDMIDSIFTGLNQSSRENTFFRTFVLLDSEDKAIPFSISPIATLNDQLMMMTLLKQLSFVSSSESKIQEYQSIVNQMETDMFDPILGFVEDIIFEELGYSTTFLHSIKYQDFGGTFYLNNVSSFSFENSLVMLDFYLQQLQDYSSEDPRGIFDLYDPTVAQNYVDYIINLIRDIQFLFQNDKGLYHEEIQIFNNSELLIFGEKSYIEDQFKFVQSLSEIIDSFSYLSNTDSRLIYIDQFQGIYISLWKFLSENAYIQRIDNTGGFGSEETIISSGYFFSYYSSYLGIFLFDNTTRGSLLIANILALNGLGVILPFQMTIEYLDPLNTGDYQTFEIIISPIPTNKSIKTSGIYFNTQLFGSVPIERISDVLISSPTITIVENASSKFNFTISEEGLSKFTLRLLFKEATFFTLEGEYRVLKSMSINIDIDPNIPSQREQITISIELRDSKGIIRSGIYYSAKIQSKSWNEPLIVDNQSLFQENGTKNSISLDSDLTENDITYYFIAYKEEYYPAEINRTIHVQTSLNFLFNWLQWIIFESEIGGYIGTLSAIFAITYGFYIRFISRIIGRTRTCKFCGESWRKKYPVCSHCGRDLKPDKSDDKKQTNEPIDYNQTES